MGRYGRSGHGRQDRLRRMINESGGQPWPTAELTRAPQLV